MIQEVLGFGKLVKQGVTTHRFIIQDKKGLYLLCVLSNGNLVTKAKNLNFKLFLSPLMNILIKEKLNLKRYILNLKQ